MRPSPPPEAITGLTVFALACFVGYYVVWRVTPALHSPLMSVTNAVSSVIIVGALIATGATAGFTFSTALGFLAVILASVNIFGGFIVTQRMLAMYKENRKNKGALNQHGRIRSIGVSRRRHLLHHGTARSFQP